MNSNRVALAGAITVVAAVTAMWMFLQPSETSDDIDTGPVASLIPDTPAPGDVGNLVGSLPPSAASSSTGAPPQAPAQVSLGGTSAKGRVERVYVRVAEGVLIDLNTALPHQRDGLRYASIEFPDPLANGATQSRAIIPDSSMDFGIGDIVEMKFAHKNIKGPYVQNIFPIIERDKVTALVSKSGTQLAQDYQRRILARNNAASGDDAISGLALWKMLPFDQAVKIVRGNGKHEVAVFSDPFCQACQAFEQTLGRIDDITLYVFMLPVIRPDKIDQSRSVWCSTDRARAWVDLAMLKKMPEAAPTCENPVDQVLSLRKTVGIRATPTVVFENGQRGQGSMLEATFRERIARAETETEQAKAK